MTPAGEICVTLDRRQIDVPASHISQLIRGKRDLTADTALRLGRFFGTGPELWLNLQKTYELDKARTELGIKNPENQSVETTGRGSYIVVSFHSSRISRTRFEVSHSVSAK